MHKSISKVADSAAGTIVLPEQLQFEKNMAAIEAVAGGPDHIDTILGIVDARMYDASGNLVAESLGNKNTLTFEGANKIRDIIFRAVNMSGSPGSNPGNGPWIALCMTASAGPLGSVACAVSSAMGNTLTYTEPTASVGYARVQPTWNTGSQGAASTSAAATFTAQANWPGVGQAFLCFGSGTNQGADRSQIFVGSVLLSFATLSGGPFVLNSGSSLQVTYNWSIS